MEFFTGFDVHASHSDLLTVNALALAAKVGRPGIEAKKVDDTTVALTLEDGRRIVASDWDNVRSVILA